MPKPLRITWVLPRPGLAGGTKSNRLLAEALERRGHRVRIAYAARPRAWPRPWRPRALARRLRRELGLLGRPRHHLEGARVELIPVDRDRVRPEDVPDADVCVASWWAAREMIEDWPASKGLKVHLIRHYELHGGDPERVRATYRLPGLKLVIASWLQRIMAEEFGDPDTVLVPNGVDWEQFGAPPRERGDPPTVGMLYGPQDWKGSACAFEAIRRARREIPRLRALAFGKSPIRAAHAPPADLEYHRRPEQRRIPELYARADCWLVSSTLEGFGMPGLEAAACRCPVVSTRCGGPEDYVKDGVSGFLVAVGDADAMAAALVAVLRQEEARWRRMSNASYRIAQDFSWDRSAERMERALYRALGGASETIARVG